MDQNELRSLFAELIAILKAELKKRMYVFRDQPALRQRKVAEMRRAIAIVVRFKDELKTPEPEQPLLLDVPRKVEYK